MATTTAAVTLTSDLMSTNMSVSASTTCMKAGTTADGLDQMESGYVEIATGTNFDLLNADNALNKDKGNKIYICNDSTSGDPIQFQLDAGDWGFIPMHGDKTYKAYSPGGNDPTVEWMVMGKDQ